jgi:hypothetical protein
MNEQRDTYSAEERRLAAALAARARQVTDADLRPPAPPGGDTSRPRSPLRWLPVLAAAAAIVAAFTLFMMIRPAEQTPPASPPSPSTSPSPSTPVFRSPDPSPSLATSPPPPRESPQGQPNIEASP